MATATTEVAMFEDFISENSLNDDQMRQSKSRRRRDQQKEFLAVNDTEQDTTRHRRAGSMRCDMESRKRQVPKAIIRTGSAPRLEVGSADDLSLPPRLQRVRSFTKTSKGLINRGDSVRRCDKRKPSDINGCDERPKSKEKEVPTNFRVLVLGASKVGKTSLITQFMTSEYMGASEVKQKCQQSVSVVVDETESHVDFIEIANNQPIASNIPFDGFVVVFSLTDKRSFKVTNDILTTLRQESSKHQAVVLVGNKIDLVRKRKITEQEGKRLAHQYDCTYMETSAAINHNVDEVLVKTVTVLRKHCTKNERRWCQASVKREATQSLRSASGFLRKFFRKLKGTKTPDT